MVIRGFNGSCGGVWFTILLREVCQWAGSPISRRLHRGDKMPRSHLLRRTRKWCRAGESGYSALVHCPDTPFILVSVLGMAASHWGARYGSHGCFFIVYDHLHPHALSRLMRESSTHLAKHISCALLVLAYTFIALRVQRPQGLLLSICVSRRWGYLGV